MVPSMGPRKGRGEGRGTRVERRGEEPLVLDLSSITTIGEVRSPRRGRVTPGCRVTPGSVTPAWVAGDSYPGGKAGSGVAERLICQMPPHSLYIEPFAGSAAVLRKKRPAKQSILIERDPSVCREWRRIWREQRGKCPAEVLTIIEGDAVRWLSKHGRTLPPDAIVYADPPYLDETRVKQQLYRYEFSAPFQHRRLIAVLRRLPCRVMLSGYWSKLYAELLGDWRSFTFQAMTRGGTMRTEWVWCNFPETEALHDYRFLGEGYRERERIKKKRTRWRVRLEAMPILERRAILAALADLGR